VGLETNRQYAFVMPGQSLLGGNALDFACSFLIDPADSTPPFYFFIFRMDPFDTSLRAFRSLLQLLDGHFASCKVFCMSLA